MSTTMETNTTTPGQGHDRFAPGTIQIGWRDRRVPMDTPITPRDVIETEAVRKAAATAERLARQLLEQVGGISP